ncbi:hypothetical protein OSB04_020353 [Centaurea solstitialis]|uniref:Signal recognition particle 9 kDa protein n=1 Tax=Centaurea solstitialis TaxID=347529 RepID=A0AA38T477_9ASTR|nr:hypothetical protein OSB04_020353 [Centaurea solstitialis]
MVYLTSWDDFVERSVQLFRSSPEKTRYAMKYRHSEGKLILKVTDDRECLKFKTDQAQDAKKMEKLNNIFFTLMARGPESTAPLSFYCFFLHCVLYYAVRFAGAQISLLTDITEVTGKEQTESHPSRKGRGRKQ